MKKLSIFFVAIFSMFMAFSFAAPSILTPSYSVNWNDVKILRTNNSNGWYVDIALQDPKTKDWLHFWEVKMSDQTFTYPKQWDWDQKVRMIPWDGWDIIEFTIASDKPAGTAEVKTADLDKETAKNAPAEDNSATRTVIPVVPKTWPSGTLIGIILAALAIFGGYIYIKKRADI